MRIGDREFDWQPTVYAGRDYVPGNRGTDIRIDEALSTPRISATERLAARKSRRVREEGDTAGDWEDPA